MDFDGNWFIVAASIVRAVLMVWFQKVEEKLTGKKGVTLCRTSLDKMFTLAIRSASFVCAKETK